MNWLGLRTVAFLAAVLGALFGSVAYAAALASGWDAPYLVGLAIVLGALLGSPDKSGMRGLLVAAAAIWVAAIVQARIKPYADAGLVGFHATLTTARLASFVACGITAFLLARRRRGGDAEMRTAGALRERGGGGERGGERGRERERERERERGREGGREGGRGRETSALRHETLSWRFSRCGSRSSRRARRHQGNLARPASIARGLGGFDRAATFP